MGRTKVYVGRLSDSEFVAYSSILLSLVAYGFGILVYESSNLKKIISNSSTFFGLNLSRDNSEHEWNNYLENLFTNKSILYFIFIPFLDFVAKKFYPKLHQEIMVAYSFLGIWKFYTIYGLVYYAVTSVAFFCVAKLNSKALVWIVSVVLMWSVHDTSVFELVGIKINTNRMNSYHEFVVIFYFMILRYVSFSIDKIDSARKKVPNVNYDFRVFLCYIFYPTFLTFAPFVSFKRFLPCLDKNNHLESIADLKWIIKYILRILISFALVEIGLRLTFTYSLVAYHRQFFSYFGQESLIMAHLLRGTLFTSKYIVYYGIPTLLNAITGISVTDLPRCTMLIHTNSELWRYLYIPLGGNKNYQLISLVLSFSFVSYWHGLGFAVTFWSIINCLMIISEIYFASFILKQNFVKEALSQCSLRKKRILLSVLLAEWQLIMYLNAGFFLDDLESVVNFYTEFFLTSKAFTHVPLAMVCFYCNAQLRLEFVDFAF